MSNTIYTTQKKKEEKGKRKWEETDGIINYRESDATASVSIQGAEDLPRVLNSVYGHHQNDVVNSS